PRLFHLLTGQPESGVGKLGTERPKTAKGTQERDPRAWVGCTKHPYCHMRDIVLSSLPGLFLASNHSVASSTHQATARMRQRRIRLSGSWDVRRQVDEKRRC